MSLELAELRCVRYCRWRQSRTGFRQPQQMTSPAESLIKVALLYGCERRQLGAGFVYGVSLIPEKGRNRRPLGPAARCRAVKLREAWSTGVDSTRTCSSCLLASCAERMCSALKAE